MISLLQIIKSHININIYNSLDINININLNIKINITTTIISLTSKNTFNMKCQFSH